MGSKMAFSNTVHHTIYIGNLTSHIPLRIAWNIEYPKTNKIPKKDILKKAKAFINIFGSTHIQVSNNGESISQIVHKNIETIRTISSVCAATWLTISWFFAPKYWAINVDHATANPVPIDINKNIMGKLTETEATASHQSLHTQKASVSWYALCKRFAKTIGIASLNSVFIIGQLGARSILFFI